MGRLLLLVTLSSLLVPGQPATDARLENPGGRLGSFGGRLGNPVTEVAANQQVVTEHFSRVQPGLIGNIGDFL